MDRGKLDAALALTIERLEVAWLPTQVIPTNGTHWYEPLRMDAFLEMLVLAVTIDPGPRYLEVGAGIGTKLLMAQALGLEVHAIESREQYVAIGKYLTRRQREGEAVPNELADAPPIAWEVADAAHYDYGRFDIIYAYRPFIGEEDQVAYEDVLTESMRGGAVLMNPCRPRINGEWHPTSHEWVWRR